MNSVQAAKQLVRQLLMDTTAVQALLGAGGAIFTDHPQAPDARAIPMPCIILESIPGGHGGYQGGFQHLRLHIYVYSRTNQDEADTLYDALYAALQMARLISTVQKAGGAPANATRGVMREDERPTSGQNEAIDAWFMRGKWIVSTAG